MSKLRALFATPGSPSLIIFAACLTKVAKHLALLACLAIVGQASGRAPIGQPAIFLIVAGASLIYSIGETLKRRQRHFSSMRR